MPSEQGIVIEGLSKSYGGFPALQAIRLELARGEVFGVLGRNGAGKTTLLRILMGLLMPSSGSAHILGLDCFADRVRLKRLIGYLPDTPFFYDHLTGRELIRFMAEVHDLGARESAERSQRLLEELQLADAADDFVTNYSLGMKKKLALILALLHEPPVLILDEPTTGLDPLASRQIRGLIRSYADRGRSVLLSTHWLEMAESVCDRVGIIHQGRLAALGTPRELRAQFEATRGAGAKLEDVFFELTAPSSTPPNPS
ncbi:MAG TPA: ABC transporter ATP-binding protein [Polyangiaceae bacterium]|jgi:ABC-2 type transport system ATP-binding protein|nr:ABC transporter ATP-binding protein [Polyangiaceae bacterium]